MVDLGFLLITFFMFTTTLSKPKTMQINMPFKEDNIKEEDQTKLKASQTMTVLLSKNHRVYYYQGIGDDPENPPQLEVTYFKPDGGIRDAIIKKKKDVEDLKRSGVLGPKDQAAVLIKPDTTSTYSDLVNMLDEMSINDVRVYAILDITEVDQEFITATEQANGIQQ